MNKVPSGKGILYGKRHRFRYRLVCWLVRHLCYVEIHRLWLDLDAKISTAKAVQADIAKNFNGGVLAQHRADQVETLRRLKDEL